MPQERRELPSRRKLSTWHGYIGGTKELGGTSFYLRVGEYDDGSPGEIFCDMARRGSFEQASMDAFAIGISIALQYGVPLESYVDRFVGTRSEPNGIVVGNEYVRLTSSVHDFVFRVLGAHYLGRRDLISGVDSDDEP